MQNKGGFSYFWALLSFVLFIGCELLIGGLIAPLLCGRFVSQPMMYKLQVIMMLMAYFAGGFTVGLVSPTVRLLEPGVGAFVAVLVTMLYTFFTPSMIFGFSTTRVLIGGGIAFGLALLGADLGERLAARLGNRSSRRYAGS